MVCLREGDGYNGSDTQPHLTVLTADYPSADELESDGLYLAKSARHAQLPEKLLRRVAEAGIGTHRRGDYYRWEQAPVGKNAALRYRLRDEEYFAPHREYANAQLTRWENNKSASLSTLELPSVGFDDVRPPASMWRRIDVNTWPQLFWAWVEGAHLYVRKFFNGDDLRKLNPDQWEFFEMHRQARVFRPTDEVLVTLFYAGSITPGVMEKWTRLWRAYRRRATFQAIDVEHDTFDGARYCVDRLPCVYVELAETSRMTRLLGRISYPTLEKTVNAYV